MKHCIKCSNEIKNNEKYCSKCGTKVEEPKTGKPILMLGIFLVLFASFALGIISWNAMNEVFRISFFSFECLLFFILSFVLKKIESKMHKLFFTVGLILIPYILTLVPYYNLLPTYYVSGAGLHVYLAIIYLVSFIIFSLININFKNGFLSFLAYLLLFLSLIQFALVFTKNSSIMALVLSAYIFILTVISILKKEKINVLSVITTIMLIIIVPYFSYVFANFVYFSDCMFNLGTLLLYLISIYLKIYKNSNSVLTGFGPFTILILTSTFIISSLYNYETISIYVLSIVLVMLYYISITFNSKVFSTITLVLTYLSLISLMLVSNIINDNMILLVVSSITLLFNLSILFIFKYKFINFIIPINIFIVVLSVINVFTKVNIINILLSVILLFLLVYIVLKRSKNKLSFTYLLSSFILSIISLNYTNTYNFEVIYFGIILALAFIFVLTIIYKENTALRVIVYIIFNLACIYLFNDLFYSLLTISGITIITGLMLVKGGYKDLKPYLLYSEILVFILTLFNDMTYTPYILFINIFIYALSYLSVILYHNKKWYRLLYIMLGLLTMSKMIGIVIEPIVISSIISISSILIILVIMYLLDIENNIEIAVISLVLLYPYYNLIDSEFMYFSELYILPALIYTIVFTEVIKFKTNESKKIWTVIPISILSYFFIVASAGIHSIIFDIVLGFIIIILGLYRKYNYLIYFGIIFIIVTIFIGLFAILDSIIIVIMLIIIGFILIGIALYNELKKKDK